MKRFDPAKDIEDEDFDPRKLLARAHQEELGRTYHRKMDQVLGHADILLFDAHASIREKDYHNAIQSYGSAYQAIMELQSMLESTIKQLIQYKVEGAYDLPFKPQI